MASRESKTPTFSMQETYELGSWRKIAGVHPAADFALEPASTALVVVDMQKKTCDPTTKRGLGAWLRHSNPDAAATYFDRLESTVLPNVERLLAFFRPRGLAVLHFVVGPARPDARDLPRPVRRVYRQHVDADEQAVIHAGSPEFDFVPSARPEAGEPVIHKRTYGGFTSTGAEGLLRNLGIDTILLVGGTAHVCVESTGRAAADLGFMVAAVEDAVIDYEPLLHDASMITFYTMLGKVVTTDQALADLARWPRPNGG